jgi:hypothetical protein
VTTLAAEVDAVDKLWTIDTMPDAPFLEAGDELVEISARFPEHIYAPTQETIPAKIRVRRAMAGTSAATHAQGITLTPVYPESASSAGSEQTVRLLGPFTITFATDLENVSGAAGPPYHELADLAAGVVVVRAVALTRVPWVLASGATAVVLAVAITDPDDGPQTAQLYSDRVDENWVAGSYAWGTVVQTVEDADTASTVGYGFTLMASSGTGAKLVCYRNDPSGAATAGETDIYIFIAESA